LLSWTQVPDPGVSANADVNKPASTSDAVMMFRSLYTRILNLL
jgi:hypothetical protein